ncbi:phosphomannomutase/phosphoglucomutase [Candidatus Micrarchaeota archaeon]|nr:phosphomannomutase/phosphoglucomutase [Candidatus Micrarchaeota archaeon]
MKSNPAAGSSLTLNPTIFREYDVRGIVGVDLDDSVYSRMGYAFGQYLKQRSCVQKPSCVVGQDNRPSSPTYATAFCNGLLDSGCDVIDIGVCTTPEIYFANDFLKTTGGAAITASHNPAQYNGVKFTYAGKSAGGSEVRAVRDLALAQGEPSALSSNAACAGLPPVRGRLKKKDIRSDYLMAVTEGSTASFRRSKVSVSTSSSSLSFPLSGMKVVLDCGNGVSALFAPELFRSLGADVVELHCDASKPFAVHAPDPVDPDNYADLSAAVVTHKAHLGLMFDGDGDRVGAVDEHGKIVAPDQMLILFARRFLKAHPGQKIVVEIKCSHAVEDEIKALGGTAIWSPTGRTLIEDVLFSQNAKLAGEMSGHFFFLDGMRHWLSESLVAARRLAELVKQNGPLSNQVASMPHYVSSREYRIEVAEEDKFDLVQKLAVDFKARHDVLTLDGAKVLFADGWGLVRASNSEPKLSLRFESKTKGGLDKIMAKFRSALKEKGVTVSF